MPNNKTGRRYFSGEGQDSWKAILFQVSGVGWSGGGGGGGGVALSQSMPSPLHISALVSAKS